MTRSGADYLGNLRYLVFVLEVGPNFDSPLLLDGSLLLLVTRERCDNGHHR